MLFNWDFGSAVGRTPTDTFVTVLLNLSTSQAVTDSSLNIVPADVFDTAPFNNSVAVLPVSAGRLGLTGEQATFDYYVVSFGVGGRG